MQAGGLETYLCPQTLNFDQTQNPVRVLVRLSKKSKTDFLANNAYMPNVRSDQYAFRHSDLGEHELFTFGTVCSNEPVACHRLSLVRAIHFID